MLIAAIFNSFCNSVTDRVPISTKVLNLSKVPLNNDEIKDLILGLSFTLTQPQNIPDLEYNYNHSTDSFLFLVELSLFSNLTEKRLKKH